MDDPSRDPSLHPFDSKYESNLHSDDVSRVDLSTNPSFDPSPYPIMCPIDDPSRDPSLHPFDSNPESYIQSNYVSRFESNDNPGISIIFVFDFLKYVSYRLLNRHWKICTRTYIHTA